MNIPFFISLVFILQLLYWFVGKRSSRQIGGKEDYFLAGKNVKFFPLMMTFIATQVGGGLILGAAEEAYQFGWGVLLYPLGSSLGLIILGAGIGKKLAGFNVSTVAQILEVVYKSKILKQLASLLSVVSLFLILTAQVIASSKFLVSLGFDNQIFFIIFWAIVVIYTAQGGLKAVISTDMVQACFFIFVFLLCFLFVFFSNSIPLSSSAPLVENISNLSSKLSGWLLMPLLFIVIEQGMGQRCFAGSSPRVVSKATFWAGMCTMGVCIIPVYFGLLAKSLNLEILQGGSVLMTVISKTTPSWLVALVGCAILAAIISTATSLINAISSNISNDFIQSPSHKMEQNPMRKEKWITVLISIAAIFAALNFNNIVGMLILSYELSVTCLFIPIFIGLFKEEGCAPSAWMSIGCGAASFVFFNFSPIPFPKEIVGILFSLFGYGVGEFFASSVRKIYAETT